MIDTTNATEMSEMFKNCTSLTDILSMPLPVEAPTKDTTVSMKLGDMSIQQLIETKRTSESETTIELINVWIKLSFDPKEYPELFL